MTTKTHLPHVQTNQNKPTLASHLSEIRRRLVVIAAVFLVVSAVAYSYYAQISAIILHPLNGQQLVYLTPGGGFNFVFMVTIYAGLLAAAPVAMYNLYGFIRPALPDRAQRSAGVVLAAATVLLMAGALYGYYIAVPSALQFLATFTGDAVTPSLTADSYMAFFLTYVAGLGVLFQLPMVLLFIHWVRPLTFKGLMQSQRYVIIGVFVVAAVVTPTPDVYNQLMIALPLLGVYQLGVVAVLVSLWRRRSAASSVIDDATA